MSILSCIKRDALSNSPIQKNVCQLLVSLSQRPDSTIYHWDQTAFLHFVHESSLSNDSQAIGCIYLLYYYTKSYTPQHLHQEMIHALSDRIADMSKSTIVRKVLLKLHAEFYLSFEKRTASKECSLAILMEGLQCKVWQAICIMHHAFL